ncbi:MAG: hemolysin family protein [Pseudanabaenaceae cyanobacterium bins.68]|nr:hemolysin family protein [Pseudanabaenaceae cyanobacterium bins.68]
MGNLGIQLLLIAALILINAFFAAAEIGLVSASDVRMKTLVEAGGREAKQARLVLKVTADSTQFLATIQVGITLSGFFTSATAAAELAKPTQAFLQVFLGDLAEPLSFVVITFLIAMISLVLGELVPKRLALRFAEETALATIQPIYWLGKVFSPIVRFLSGSTNLILIMMGHQPGEEEPEANIEEIKAMVDAARTGGMVGEQERRIIYGAVELSHILARAIMVPRVQIQYIKSTTTFAETIQLVSENAHTRLPVCEDGLDNIIGILHVKDLIRPELGDRQPDIRELLRPVRYVSENHSASDILRDMQKSRLHLVIVQDEFGGTSGLITLEDILEEIVGEIRDEYDAEEEREFRRIAEHEGIFKIRASIATVNNELNLQLPREDAATLVGLFLDELQRSPEPGDHLEIDDIHLTVLEDGQRVRVCLIEKDDPI